MAHCEQADQSPGSEWRGLAIEEVGSAFAGPHGASLQWLVEPPGSATSTPVSIVDRISITIAYDPTEVATVSCNSILSLPVTVTIATSASGLVDAGPGTLQLDDGTRPLMAKLSFEGPVLSLDARLSEAAASATPVGSLRPHDASQSPGANAVFPSQLEVEGAGGGTDR